MDERELRTMIDEVKAARLSRRHFIQTMIGLGLTAPLAGQMLASAGVAQAQSKLAYKPTKRGGGGALKTLWWQGATLLNPHFATGTKDQDGSRIFYEPLAAWDPDGNLAPMLAAEIPTAAERRPGQGRQVGHLEAQEGRQSGTTASRSPPTTACSPGSTPPTRPPPSVTDRHLQGRQGREGRQPHGQGRVQRSRRRSGPTPSSAPRHGHPQAPVRRLQGRQVARGADQPQAGRHRPLPLRGLQAGRHGARQAQPELPHAQPALLRHHRDEGRRRCGLGRARRDADRRVRLRLEHAGRGRDPQAPGAGRQGQGRHRGRRQHRAHPVQLHRSRGTRSTASARASRPSTRS